MAVVVVLEEAVVVIAKVVVIVGIEAGNIFLLFSDGSLLLIFCIFDDVNGKGTLI